MAPETPDGPDAPEVPDFTVEKSREQVADDLADVMSEALRKVESGRIQDSERERVRIKWMRAFIAAATEYRQQLDEIDKQQREHRIERLEQQIEDLHEVV